MRHRNPLEAVSRSLVQCAHGTTGGEQFCIFCLRKLSDDARAAIDAARTVVKDSVLACSWVREADFEAGARCDCPSCTAAQALVDALAKVPE